MDVITQLCNMKTILYIHGFSSSGASGTVTMLRNLLYPRPVRVIAPDLPVMPSEAIDLLRQTIEQEQPDLIIGTSMGGLYTELLTGHTRIMVNPSFAMSRSLTFRGLGNYEFLNKRADGVQTFKVDKVMINQFKDLEKQLFAHVDDEERDRVYGLFGTHDTTVNFQSLYCKHYGRQHFTLFEGEHRLNDKVLKAVVLPLILQLLGPL